MHIYFEGDDDAQHWTLADLVAEQRANNAWFWETHARTASADVATGAWEMPTGPEATVEMPLYEGGLGYPAAWVTAAVVAALLILAVTGW